MALEIITPSPLYPLPTNTAYQVAIKTNVTATSMQVIGGTLPPGLTAAFNGLALWLVMVEPGISEEHIGDSYTFTVEAVLGTERVTKNFTVEVEIGIQFAETGKVGNTILHYWNSALYRVLVSHVGDAENGSANTSPRIQKSLDNGATWSDIALSDRTRRTALSEVACYEHMVYFASPREVTGTDDGGLTQWRENYLGFYKFDLSTETWGGSGTASDLPELLIQREQSAPIYQSFRSIYRGFIVELLARGIDDLVAFIQTAGENFYQDPYTNISSHYREVSYTTYNGAWSGFTRLIGEDMFHYYPYEGFIDPSGNAHCLIFRMPRMETFAGGIGEGWSGGIFIYHVRIPSGSVSGEINSITCEGDNPGSYVGSLDTWDNYMAFGWVDLAGGHLAYAIITEHPVWTIVDIPTPTAYGSGQFGVSELAYTPFITAAGFDSKIDVFVNFNYGFGSSVTRHVIHRATYDMNTASWGDYEDIHDTGENTDDIRAGAVYVARDPANSGAYAIMFPVVDTSLFFGEGTKYFSFDLEHRYFTLNGALTVAVADAMELRDSIVQESEGEGEGGGPGGGNGDGVQECPDIIVHSIHCQDWKFVADDSSPQEVGVGACDGAYVIEPCEP